MIGYGADAGAVNLSERWVAKARLGAAAAVPSKGGAPPFMALRFALTLPLTNGSRPPSRREDGISRFWEATWRRDGSRPGTAGG